MRLIHIRTFSRIMALFLFMIPPGGSLVSRSCANPSSGRKSQSPVARRSRNLQAVANHRFAMSAVRESWLASAGRKGLVISICQWCGLVESVFCQGKATALPAIQKCPAESTTHPTRDFVSDARLEAHRPPQPPHWKQYLWINCRLLSHAFSFLV